ncbi:hypothetical protein AB0C02_33015 [Micromonospora sp. NPDC048999]|uniref:hypothetical protein n=1 Tax=Micromonospora sp. NPDC048999 TaxID=3155391 RepID=UPI0033DFECD9
MSFQIASHLGGGGRASTRSRYDRSAGTTSGYAAGALVAPILADALGLNATIIAAAVLTAASGIFAAGWIAESP